MKITKRQLKRIIREEKTRLMQEGSGTDQLSAIEAVETAIITMRSLGQAPGAADPVAQEMLLADAQDLETIVLGFLERIS